VPAGAGYADVDLRSDGCGESDPRTETRNFTEPSLSPLPVIVGQEQVVVQRAQAPVANRLVGSTRNVSSLAVDAGPAGACIGSGEVTYEITSDGPLTLALTDGRVLELPAAGSWKGTIPSLDSLKAARASGKGNTSTLPATGGHPMGVPIVAALLALTIVARRISGAGRGLDARSARGPRRARRPRQ
jgi:hypothetical protein